MSPVPGNHGPAQMAGRSSLRAAWLLAVLCGMLPVARGAQSQSPRDPEDGYVRAESLVRNHQWDEGLAILESLLRQEPRNLKAMNLAGLACTGKGDIPQAEQYFEKALAMDPLFLPALKNLGIDEFHEGKIAPAARHLLAAAKQTPGDPVVNLFLGQIDFRNKDFKLAAGRLDVARALVPLEPDVAAELTISLLETGEKDRATELLGGLGSSTLSPELQLAVGISLAQADMAIQSIPFLKSAYDIHPDSYDIGFDLALTAVQAKAFRTAIQTAETLVRRGHDTSELENILAEAEQGQGETQKAVDAYRKAIALDPGDENNYLDFTSLCIDHRAFDDGMKVITVGLDARPNSERLTFMRGILYAMQDQFELAENDFQKASLLAPQSDFGDVGLGVTYLEIGNSDKAIQILRDRLRQKPNDANLLYLLGEGLLRSGATPGQPAYAEAQNALEKSTRLNPKLCLAHVSLGTIYLDEDRVSEALAQFEQARTIDPTEKSSYSHLAVAYRRLNQPAKAKEILVELKEILDQQRAGMRVQVKSPMKEKTDDAPGQKQP